MFRFSFAAGFGSLAMPRRWRHLAWRKYPMHKRRIELISTFADTPIIFPYPQHKRTQIAFLLELLPAQRNWQHSGKFAFTIRSLVAMFACIPGKNPGLAEI